MLSIYSLLRTKNMVAGLIISGLLGAAIGGFLNRDAVSDTNETNMEMFNEQMQFNREQAKWQTSYAERAWQTSRADRLEDQYRQDTQMQRSVADHTAAGFSPLAALGSGTHGSQVSTPSPNAGSTIGAPVAPHMATAQYDLGMLSDVIASADRNRAMDIQETKNLNDVELTKVKLQQDRDLSVEQMANTFNIARAQIDANVDLQSNEHIMKKFQEEQATSRLLMQQKHSDLQSTRDSFKALGIPTYIEPDPIKLAENNNNFIRHYSDLVMEYMGEDGELFTDATTSRRSGTTGGLNAGLNAGVGTGVVNAGANLGVSDQKQYGEEYSTKTDKKATFEERKRQLFAQYQFALSPVGGR
ncbi:DNA pilot protein [Tortoise microvirus 109]|nr:DNA pilot protein [Tortoise microvirus 109]